MPVTVNEHHYTGFRRDVLIAGEVWHTWSRNRQLEPAHSESFGVLIGWTSEDRRKLHVTDITVPMRGDHHSQQSFLMQDPGHQASVEQSHRESGGTHIYLGTWHTHPQRIPSPSGIDKADWRRCMKRNPGRSLLFVIVGTEETRIYVPWGPIFRSLRPRSDE